jgi:anti-sigma B factor antagonist
MQFEVEPTSEDGAVIRLYGQLNMVAAPRFRELMTRIVDRERRTRVVVDLAGTDFMDSTGLGALISGLKTTRLAGGDLRIARPGTQVMTVLKLTKLDQILHPHDTVEECFELAVSASSPTPE